MGRPTKMTDVVVGKLEEAFAVDATIEQACLYAGVHRDTYYDYIKKHPEYPDRVDKLRGMTGLKAKINIRNLIDEGSAIDSKWHLERRDPDYKPKSKVESEVNISAQDELILALAERRRDREGKE